MKMLERHGVSKMSVVGISYSGFVGYNMVVQFPQKMERLVLYCAGVCLEEEDMENGLFRVPDLEEAIRILLPQTPNKLRELGRFSFVKPATGVPAFVSTFRFYSNLVQFSSKMGSRRSLLKMISDPILICLFFDSEFPTNPGLLEYDEIPNLANLSLYRTQVCCFRSDMGKENKTFEETFV
ncbi:hypothetical protein EZV62_016172 [Acer yangbiense]|uniref:AB hydrolase-1 domain-containing protein n=1 Tax=Acer yangbiense TaxID=1000413 RepID=A0A5C7HMT8_9ROSI|nr:hypothetical protein EZV62_016172 [Acer yangbiense]